MAAAFDAQGNLFVTDSGYHGVCEYDGNGRFLARWRGSGSNTDQLEDPSGIAVDGQGNVYVADATNGSLEKFHLP